jgi:hypothetical protein
MHFLLAACKHSHHWQNGSPGAPVSFKLLDTATAPAAAAADEGAKNNSATQHNQFRQGLPPMCPHGQHLVATPYTSSTYKKTSGLHNTLSPSEPSEQSRTTEWTASAAATSAYTCWVSKPCCCCSCHTNQHNQLRQALPMWTAPGCNSLHKLP